MKTTYVFRDGEIVEKPRAQPVQAIEWLPMPDSYWIGMLAMNRFREMYEGRFAPEPDPRAPR